LKNGSLAPSGTSFCYKKTHPRLLFFVFEGQHVFST